MRLKTYFLSALSILLLVVVACSKAAPSEKIIKHSVFVFGTIVDITFYGDDSMQTTEALQSINEDFKVLNRAWNPWDNMALGRANNLINTTKWFSYNPSISQLLVDGKKYAKLSQDLFNPTIGKLTKLWGFHSDKSSITTPPTAQEIREILSQSPSMADITIKGIRIKSSNPNIVFDFGAMAKGLAVDTVINNLKQFNISNAMINAGGDIKAIGKHANRAWHIGIRHPRIKDRVLAGIDLHANESIFTSGDYERYFMYQGQRYHHIIDPRTGYPATESQSVTVIHTNAALADAAATALFVAGPDKWHAIAKAMGIKYVLLVDAKGTIHMNPAMQQRIELQDKSQKILISNRL